jgi:hypothetical protein
MFQTLRLTSLLSTRSEQFDGMEINKPIALAHAFAVLVQASTTTAYYVYYKMYVDYTATVH